MNKKDLSERDICTKFITPAVRTAGWDLLSQVREEFGFTKGRIIVRGKLVTRGKIKRADYILYYKPNLPIALIEQRGRHPADYGEEAFVHLSASLSAEFGRGFSRANLEYMRKFYLLWQDRPGLISQMASGKLPAAEIPQTVSAKSPAAKALGWCGGSGVLAQRVQHRTQAASSPQLAQAAGLRVEAPGLPLRSSQQQRSRPLSPWAEKNSTES